MSKVILEFTKGHGRYVKGDVAGFDEVKAAKLRGVTKPFDANAKKAVDEIETLADRAAALDAREAELNARIAAAGDPPAAKEADGEKAGAGDPPAQGQKAK